MSRNTTGGAILFLAACALLAATVAASGAGGAQNADSGGGSQSPNAGGHGAGHGAGRSSQDTKFATFAAMGGAAEVEMGRLAAQQGASDEVRQFGRRMVDEHTRANGELTQLAASKGMTLPAALDAKHQSAMRRMQALTGERFDREYVKMMVAYHRKTVAEFRREAERGADPDLKAFAARALPALREHLRMAERIYDKMLLRRGGHLTNSNAGSNANNSNR